MRKFDLLWKSHVKYKHPKQSDTENVNKTSVNKRVSIDALSFM